MSDTAPTGRMIIEQINRAIRDLQPVNGIQPGVPFRIISTPLLPPGTRTRRFMAHPFVQWLARWLPIRPYDDIVYPDPDAPRAWRVGATIYASPAFVRNLAAVVDLTVP